MDFPRVFVTGIGCISSLGKNVAENIASLSASKTGIHKAHLIDSRLKEEFQFAEINLSNDELRKHIGKPIPAHFARTTLLGTIASLEAIYSAQIKVNQLDGIIMGCTVSAMCETDNLYQNAQGFDNDSPFCDSYDIGSGAMEIGDFLGGLNYHNTINTACSSSANAILQGALMIRSKRAKRLIVGGADALSKYTINGFNSMMLLSNDKCRPFQKERDGINLGEAAAFLILESEEVIGNKIPLAELIGFGNANDSYHPTSISENGEGPFLAMQKALNSAQIKSDSISYINAHGTGTDNNDEAEGIALKRIFGEQVPPFSSTKIYTGHTLGAAGALETVFSIEMMRKNEIFGDNDFLEMDEKIGLTPSKSIKSSNNIHKIMSNSFGFGGNCTSLIFSKI